MRFGKLGVGYLLSGDDDEPPVGVLDAPFSTLSYIIAMTTKTQLAYAAIVATVRARARGGGRDG